MATTFTFTDAATATGSTDDTIPAAATITDAVLLDKVKQAIWALVDGGKLEVSIGNRRWRAIDLPELRALRWELEGRIEAASDGLDGPFVLGMMRTSG